jgi:hypothetical protein
LLVHTDMNNPAGRSSKPGPRGAEGVPVDAPDNEAPAISPQAVSRMHRAEDDRIAIENSPEFTDQPLTVRDRHHDPAPAAAVPSGIGPGTVAYHARDDEDPKNGEPNPSHRARKSPDEPPRGLGDGELMEQPDSAAEARNPGAK